MLDGSDRHNPEEGDIARQSTSLNNFRLRLQPAAFSERAVAARMLELEAAGVLSEIMAQRTTPADPEWLAHMLGLAMARASTNADDEQCLSVFPLSEQTMNGLESAMAGAAHLTYEEHRINDIPLPTVTLFCTD